LTLLSVKQKKMKLSFYYETLNHNFLEQKAKAFCIGIQPLVELVAWQSASTQSAYKEIILNWIEMGGIKSAHFLCYKLLFNFMN